MDVVALGLARADAARRYLPRGQAVRQLRPIATRVNHYGNSTYLSQSGQTSATYRVQHFLYPGLRSSGVRLLYGAWAGQFPGAAVNLRSSIDWSGKAYAQLFRGQELGAIPEQGSVLTDLHPLTFDLGGAADFFWTRTFVELTSGTGQWPIGLSLRSANGEGSSIGAPGTNLVASGQNRTLPATPGATTAGAYSPLGILGYTTPDVEALGIITDSIGIGTGDVGTSFGTGDTLSDNGFVNRMTNREVPHLFMAKYGETAVNTAASRHYRAMVLDYCTRVLCTMGRNDITAGSTPTTIGNALVTLWLLGYLRGLPVYQSTITPEATSTDLWATVGAQTTTANEANRVTVNDWLRAGAPINPTTLGYVAVGTSGALHAGEPGHPLTAVYDVADAVESARNSGKWKAAERTVTDAAATTTTLTSATASFTSADVGKQVLIAGAGAAGVAFGTTISVVTNSTTATLASGVPTNVTGQRLTLAPYAVDGTHPGAVGHAAMAAVIQPLRTAMSVL